MTANLGVPFDQLKAVSDALQVLLADEFVLYTKTRNYHWNVEGPNFMEMHKFYESQYKQLEEMIDEIAERIRTIGHYSEGRLKDFVRLTRLDEPGYSNDQEEQISNLLSDHETIIQYLRRVAELADKNRDLGSSDFSIGMMKQHEKMAWMLRSYLQK